MFRWLDIIDQQQLHHLIHSHNLQLTYKTRQFLESFARLVNKATTTHTRLIAAANKRRLHLQTVNALIAAEVTHLQQTFPNADIVPYRHPETSLPIVYTRLPHVPDLVVHVFRSYAETGTALAFGFRAYSFCRGQLTGPIARAANYLRARSTANDWKLSLTQLITLWCQQIEAIPLEQRVSIPKPSMLKRRREKVQKSPDDEHASIPQNHPKTDVVIKDDKLFPNRTFHDPEELYAEQVREIRKKRKPVPGVLDDYELAWKKRRPRHDTPAAKPETHHPTAEQPTEESKPPPQASSARPSSLFPFQSPDNPKADAPQPAPQPTPQPTPQAHLPELDSTPKLGDLQPPASRAESPEEPEFSFHNPLSPEVKDSSSGETPSPTDQLETPQHTAHDAARMEAAERAVLTKPAESRNVPPPQNDADNNQGADESGPSMFFFSTAMDAHAPPAADTGDDVVRSALQEEAVVATTLPEEKEEPLAIPPPATEKADVVTAPPEVTQSQEQSLTLSAGEDGKSELGDKGNTDDHGDPVVDDVDKVDKQTPKVVDEDSGKEDSQVQADANDPEDISVPDNSKQSLPPKTVSETHDRADAKDDSSKRDATEIAPPANTEPLTDSSLKASKEKKRIREINYSGDVIIVDPDSEKENEKNPKKRRLSSSPGKAKVFSLPQEKNLVERPSPRNVDVSTPDRTVPSPDQTPERTVRSPEREARSPERTIRSPERKFRSSERAGQSPKRADQSPERADQSPERAGQSPERTAQSPKKTVRSPDRTVRSLERSAPSLETDTKTKSAQEVVRPRTEKEVTPDVELPAGVDCDPCPMALSEPESSDYSSDHNSNSDAGSISDVEHDER